MSDNKKSVLSAVSHLLAFAADGSPDWDTSLDRIQGAIEGELSQNRETDVRIEAALDSIYDKLPMGTGVPGPTVVQLVAGILANGDFLKQIEVEEYLAHSTRFVEFVGKVEEYLARSTRFVSKRGRSGGLFRIG